MKPKLVKTSRLAVMGVILFIAITVIPGSSKIQAQSATSQSFENWAATLAAGVNGPNDDSDGDGVVNLVEYALGMNPNLADPQALPTASYENGIATYSVTKPKSVVGVEFQVRFSNDVSHFNQLAELSKVDETATQETWAVSVEASDPAGFAWVVIVKLSPPSLTGFDGASRPAERDYVLPYDVQAAFNEDTFFWHVSYPGNEGKRHQYIRYTNGAWQKEGGARRDAQSSIDDDPIQGGTGTHSTIYEQRTSIMMSDPQAISHVTNFAQFACFLSCHNKNRNMPEWTEAAGEDTKYIDPSQVSDGGVNSSKVLDLWHWRGGRSNPIGRADDQYVLTKEFDNSTGDDDGGRKGDAGTGVFKSQNIVDGHPEFVFNPSTAGGNFVFNWENFWSTPYYYITQPDAEQLGPNAPNPVILPYADALAAGYIPSEGDTVPQRILRAGAGSRADITADGTQFIRETPDTVFGQEVLGVWSVQMQRLLNTGNDDDVALVPGNTYNLGFEVHLWEYTARDHYVSFPTSLTLGSGGDVEAVDLRPATGKDILPNWDNTDEFPVKRIYLFQPGINTWEFLIGKNQEENKVYIDPATQSEVSQIHSGASSVASGVSCASCHTVRKSGDPAPTLFNAGSMETLAPMRGGIWARTPVLQ